MSARVVSHVACRIALILAPADGWPMGGSPVDAAIAGHLDAEPRLLNLSAPDRVLGKGEYNDQAPVETVVAHQPDDAALSGFGLEHPSDIVLLYSRDSSRAVARIEIGGPAKDGLGLYARVQGSGT